MSEHADVLVVGGGPAGYVAALRAAELGRRVTLIERAGREGGLGGACLHVGCVPSKALIELAGTYERVTAAAMPGLAVDDARIDLVEFQAWKRTLVAELAEDVRRLLDRKGVRHLAGEAHFSGPRRVAVVTGDGPSAFVEFDQAIVATGSRSVELPELPVDGERVLSSSDVLDLAEIPRTVAIVGAGYIGIELGTALAKLGSAVTIVDVLDRILPSVDVALTKPVARKLERLGVELRLGARVVGVDGADLVLDAGDGQETRVEAERIVVAVGRRPNTDSLGLERAGVATDEAGSIPVDRSMLASARVAAIGDVTAGPALAHKASAQAIVAAEALSGRPAAFDVLGIPMVVFSDPEVAYVGMTAGEARAAGLDVAVLQSPARANARAAILGAPDGMTRVVVDREGDRVIGVQIVGAHASELIAEAGLAIEMVAGPADLLGTIHPHPTLSEGLHAAVEQVR